ncbi:MAG TPA: hypothetical protein VK139_01640, partial [Microbacteriaceae bacterium]|nr:hypothetical protein [Microbacteriaceae bacterium]
MTNAERVQARAEVESARAALVTHMAQLEEAANLPKRASRRIGLWAKRARDVAEAQPAAAVAVVAAGLAGAAGVVALIVR